MRKLDRAWTVAAGCCLIQAGILGLVVNCRGIFFTPICTDLGLDLSAFTLYGVFYGVFCSASIPLVSRIFNRVNLKVMFASCSVLMSALLFACAFFSEVWQWYLAAAMEGICGAFLYSITTATLINNWFLEKKGLALGIAGAAPGITGALFNPLGASVIRSFGWRTGYMFFALSFLLMVFPSSFMVKLRPGDNEKALGEERRTETSEGCTASQAKRMPSFYLMIVFSAAASALTCYTQMLNSYGESLGYDAAVSSVLVSFSMIGNIVLKFIVGIVQDRKGEKKALAATFLFLVLSYFSLLCGRMKAFIFIGSFLSGAPMALTMVVLPVLVRKLFGNRDYSRIFGYITMSGNLFASLGITLFGFVIDKSGFASSQILCILLSVLILLLGTASIKLTETAGRN